MWSSGSQSRTWQANLVASRSVEKPSIGAAPLLPSINELQYSSSDLAIALTVPMPVTTTPRRLLVIAPRPIVSYRRAEPGSLPVPPESHFASHAHRTAPAPPTTAN